MAIGKAKVRDYDPRPEGDGHLVSEPAGGGDCHGGYRSLLETGVEHLGSGEQIPFAFGERASHQASAGAKNRPEGQRVDCRPATARFIEGEFCPAANHSAFTGPDADASENPADAGHL